jgi:hypothetical protein
MFQYFLHLDKRQILDFFLVKIECVYLYFYIFTLISFRIEISFECLMVKNCPFNMAHPESIINIKKDTNDFELLKESAKNETLEEYLKDKDINSLAFFAAEEDEKDCLKILINKGLNLSVGNKDNETVLDAIFEKVSNPEKFLSDVLDSKVDLDKSSSRRKKIYKFGEFT